MTKKKKPEPVGEVDEDGTRWTANSYTLASGEGETFGPNHPAVPAKVLALRQREHPEPRPDDSRTTQRRP